MYCVSKCVLGNRQNGILYHYNAYHGCSGAAATRLARYLGAQYVKYVNLYADLLFQR